MKARSPKRAKPCGSIETWGEYDIPWIGHRRVRVFRPGDAQRPGVRRLLVLFDGQNVFDDVGSFSGGWYAHDAVDKLATKKRLAPYIVALDHGGEQRIHELSPFVAPPTEGRFPRLLDWMGDHLLPELHSRLPVRTEPAATILGGSSMGGLAAMYGHFRRPDLFGGALVMSPAFWIGYPAIFEFVAKQPKPWATKIYLDCGALEGSNGGMLRLAERMATMLRVKGWDDSSLLWVADRRGRHSERDWRRRLPKALKYLFP